MAAEFAATRSLSSNRTHLTLCSRRICSASPGEVERKKRALATIPGRLSCELPATTGNPRPFGMPPFGHVLDDKEIADVLTYVRGAWGNDAPAVTVRDTMRH